MTSNNDVESWQVQHRHGRNSIVMTRDAAADNDDDDDDDDAGVVEKEEVIFFFLISFDPFQLFSIHFFFSLRFPLLSYDFIVFLELLSSTPII